MPLTPTRIQARTRLLNVARKAGYFNGTNAYAVVPGFNNYSELTLYIIFMSPDVSKRGGLMRQYWGWNNYGFDIEQSVFSGYLAVRYGAGTTNVTDHNAYLLKNFTWYHVAVVFPPQGVDVARLYVNGSFVKSYSYGYAPPSSLQDLYIGSAAPNTVPFYGYIAEVLLYSRALSNTEIQQIYNYPYNPPLNGLVLWLDGDSLDCTNGKWYDKSGFGNNATLSNVQCVNVVSTPTRVLTPVS